MYMLAYYEYKVIFNPLAPVPADVISTVNNESSGIAVVTKDVAVAAVVLVSSVASILNLFVA
jgi:hypothetical protein